MKKILGLFLVLSLISCADKTNTEIQEAFIAISVLDSFISDNETQTYVEGDIQCDHGGKFTYVEDEEDGGVNGYIISNCIFTPTSSLLDLKENCSKNQNQEISGFIDVNVENKITGSLSFKGLYEKSNSCSFNITIGEDGPISGTICGYTVEEIIAGSFSSQNPTDEICSFLN